MMRSIALLAACLCLVQCGQHVDPCARLLPDTLQLQAGDVVFRTCSGLTSSIVTWYDRDGGFSHVGIVADSAGQAMIVHAVPGEPDFPGDPDRVKMERPEKFFSTDQVTAGGVYRPVDAEAGRKAASVAMEKYRDGVLFDHRFDDSDTTQMYCTELIIHAFRRAGMELVGDERHVVDLPGMHYRSVLPSQLQKSPFFKQIFISNPQKN